MPLFSFFPRPFSFLSLLVTSILWFLAEDCGVHFYGR